MGLVSGTYEMARTVCCPCWGCGCADVCCPVGAGRAMTGGWGAERLFLEAAATHLALSCSLLSTPLLTPGKPDLWGALCAPYDGGAADRCSICPAGIWSICLAGMMVVDAHEEGPGQLTMGAMVAICIGNPG